MSQTSLLVPRMTAHSAVSDGIGFRALAERDFPLMQAWLSRSHVMEWWRQPLDLEGVASKYRPVIEGRKPSHVFVIELGGRPIGWIQWYRCSDFPEHAQRISAEPNTAGIDFAIGEPELLGHGLGPRVIAAFIQQHVFVDASITACLSDPDALNTRSTRALEKAGFVTVRSVHDAAQARTSSVMQLTREAVRAEA